jgi:hypothetical protein
MKRVLVLVTIAALAHADSQLPVPVQNALTSIDTVPTVDQLNLAFGTDPLTGLTQIAQDVAQKPGIRLRAIHALVHYCSTKPPCGDLDPARQALLAIITANQNAQAGANLLMLRAAIESLGPMQNLSDTPTLEGFLDHSSRDVRATAALALGDLCDTSASSALHIRLQHESVDQVRLAISTALRVLNTCSITP